MEIKSIKFTNKHYAVASLEVEGKTFEFNFAMLSEPGVLSLVNAYQLFEAEKIETQTAAYLYERVGSQIAAVVLRMSEMKASAEKHNITIL